MTLAANGAILPVWAVLPPAFLMLLVLGVHVLSIQSSGVPARRRRIRTASGLLMMFVTALLAYALCIDPFASHPALAPHEAQNTLLLWLAIVGLVGVVVVLAALDVLHTISLGLLAKQKLRESVAERMAADVAARHGEAVGTGRLAGPEVRPGTGEDRARG